MTREEILALLNKVRDVGLVKHADFIDYVVVLEGRRKVHPERGRRMNGESQTVEHAYMTIDGTLRVAMANLDHRQQNKRLDFGEPKVLADSAEQLTLQVTVTSEVYGMRHGIATSRKKTGTNAEKDWPGGRRNFGDRAVRLPRWATDYSLGQVSQVRRTCCVLRQRTRRVSKSRRATMEMGMEIMFAPPITLL